MPHTGSGEVKLYT